MWCDDVMNPLLRHRSRCVYLGTSLGNIIIALLASFVVTVQSGNKAQFLPDQKNITVREGGVAILPCSVRHLGTKHVAWRRIESGNVLAVGKMALESDNRVQVDYSKKGVVSIWNLIIKHIRPDEGGIYECQITSRVGHVKHVQLNVVGPPILKAADSSTRSRGSSTHSVPYNINEMPVVVCTQADEKGCLISITGRKFVDLGDEINLRCNASGGARVADEIDWFKGGDKIDATKYSHVFIEKFKDLETSSFVSVLTIPYSTLEDTGDYICRSSRTDIANLKVTVLHAETEPKRRGTENGRTQGSYRVEGDGTGSSIIVSPSRRVMVFLLCVTFTALQWVGNATPYNVLLS